MAATEKVFIPFIHFVLQVINADIELKADQENQGIEINKQHEYQYCTDRSI